MERIRGIFGRVPVAAAAPRDGIGQATMKEDGTLVLWLRAEDGSGTVGSAQLACRPGEPAYERTLRHIGGLRPGESKGVPPWEEPKG